MKIAQMSTKVDQLELKLDQAKDRLGWRVDKHDVMMAGMLGGLIVCLMAVFF